MRREKAAADQVDDTPEFGVALVIVARAVAVALQFLDLVGFQPEDEDVFFSHLLEHLNVGSVKRSYRQRTVESELHVSGSGGLRAGCRYLLGKVGGGEND